MGGLRERELYRSRRRGLLPRRDRPWRRSPGAASILLSTGNQSGEGQRLGLGRARRRQKKKKTIARLNTFAGKESGVVNANGRFPLHRGGLTD